MHGDLIYIPKGLNLLVDDVRINHMTFAGIIVEGGLFFDDSVQIELNTNLIQINGGIMKIGSESEPFNNNLVITFTASRVGPVLPEFGNNVLAVLDGELSIHGAQKIPSWTHLQSSVIEGENVIVLNEDVNWQVGDEVVITGTGYSAQETEYGVIEQITNNRIITLEEPLQFNHVSSEKTLRNGEVLSMRAEVGVLSRNVKI